VLHPQHKLLYFKTARWEDDWIKIAETLIQDEYTWTYTSNKDGGDDSEDADLEMQPDPSNQSIKTVPNIFDNLPALAPLKGAILGCKFNQYLTSDV